MTDNDQLTSRRMTFFGGVIVGFVIGLLAGAAIASLVTLAHKGFAG